MQEKTISDHHVVLYKRIRFFKNRHLQVRVNTDLVDFLIAEAKQRKMKIGTLAAEKLSALLIAENQAFVEKLITENDL